MKYVNGDIREAKESVIAHGCNTQGVMGSGVALAIKRKWPDVYAVYCDHLKNGGGWLGDCSVCQVEMDRYVVNLYTQKFYGTETRHVNYAAILTSLDDMFGKLYLISNTDIKSVAIPKIGAGLGGGDWNIIKALLLDYEKLRDVEFVVYCIE